MENASKALIIAGAILLSILIIGLGMTVYNNASSAGGQANLESQEIQSHNSQFLAYEGKQKGTNVKALVNAIKINNQNHDDRMIKITFSETTDHPDDVPIWTQTGYSAGTDPNGGGRDLSTYQKANNKIKSTTTYFVTFANGNNGCIAGVEIHVYSDADL